MPTNDTKQSNSYCPKHNTQHKAIFSYTLIPHLKLPTQILLRIANKKKLHPQEKIFIPKEKNIFWHRQSIFQSLENIFQALEFKFQALESRFQSLESSFTSGRKIFPIRRKIFFHRDAILYSSPTKELISSKNYTKHLQTNFYIFA
jgi:hypothetical protein